MGKFFSSLLLLFFIIGMFANVSNFVSASKIVEDSWSTKAPMNQARGGSGVVTVDGKIYAIGGFLVPTTSVSDRVFVGTNECYDPGSETWVTLEPMPTPRFDFAIAAYEDKIYCIGGIVRVYTDVKGNHEFFWCKTVEAYDTITDTWSTKKSSSASQCSHAQVVDGKIFVTAKQALFMYDTLKDSWIRKASMPETPNIVYSVTSIDNKLIVTYTASSISNYAILYHPKVMIYDPTYDGWREGKTGPAQVALSYSAGATTGLYAPPRVYILGNNQDNMTPVTVVYDLFKDVWSTGQPIPTKDVGGEVAVVDDILYVISGEYNYRYIPKDYQGLGPLPETSKSAAVTSLPIDTSSPYEALFLTAPAVAAIVIVAGLIGLGLVLLQKRKPWQQKLLKTVFC